MKGCTNTTWKNADPYPNYASNKDYCKAKRIAEQLDGGGDWYDRDIKVKNLSRFENSLLDEETITKHGYVAQKCRSKIILLCLKSGMVLGTLGLQILELQGCLFFKVCCVHLQQMYIESVAAAGKR